VRCNNESIDRDDTYKLFCSGRNRVLLFREAFHDRVNSPRSLIEIQSLIVDRFWRCHKRISIGVARYRKERKERRVNGIRRDERKREKERERDEYRSRLRGQRLVFKVWTDANPVSHERNFQGSWKMDGRRQRYRTIDDICIWYIIQSPLLPPTYRQRMLLIDHHKTVGNTRLALVRDQKKKITNKVSSTDTIPLLRLFQFYSREKVNRFSLSYNLTSNL